jgi:hypothetical protein
MGFWRHTLMRLRVRYGFDGVVNKLEWARPQYLGEIDI